MRQHHSGLFYPLLFSLLLFGVWMIQQDVVQAQHLPTKSKQLLQSDNKKVQLEEQKLELEIQKLQSENNKAQSELQKINLENEKLKMENTKLENDNKTNKTQAEANKLNLETEKLEMEKRWRVPIVSNLLAGGSILLVVIGYLVQRTLAIRQEKANLQIKAAELVLASPTQPAAQRRLDLLKRMFGRRLDRKFAENFNPGIFPSTQEQEMRSTLFQELARASEKPEQVLQVLRAWKTIFPMQDEQVTRWRKKVIDDLLKEFTNPEHAPDERASNREPSEAVVQ